MHISGGEMDINAEVTNPYDVDADVLVVAVFEGEGLDDPFLKELDQRTSSIVGEVLASGEMRGEPGEMVYIHQPGRRRASRRLLAGAGKRKEFSFYGVSKYAGAAARFLRAKQAKSIAIVRRSDVRLTLAAQAAVEGVLTGLFEPDVYRTRDKEDHKIE